MPDENPLFQLDDEALIKHLADAAELHARNILITRAQPDLAAFFHLVTPSQNMLVSTPWRNDEEKYAATQTVRRWLKRDKAKAYCFTSECWMARYDIRDAPAGPLERPEVMPRDRPDRMECVVIFASTRTKRSMRVLEMIRDPKGKLIDLKVNEKPWGDAEKGEEGFAGTFPSLFEGL